MEQERSQQADSRIDTIMHWFDFDRVHRAMVALDWIWTDCRGVPEVGNLREEAHRLLREIANKPEGWSVGCGGFVARNHGNNRLELAFEVSSWDAGGEE